MTRSKRGLAAWLTVLSACVACTAGGERDGGDTHWLGSCTSDADCNVGTCLCGMCTAACSGDDACQGGPPAACFETASPGVLLRCGGTGPADATGLCIATCDVDTDCPSSMSCMGGACAANEPLAERPSANDYADVSAGVDLTEGIVLPPPVATIGGDASAFEGRWDLWDDGAPCDVGTYQGGVEGGLQCPHVEITQQADGSWRGVVWGEGHVDYSDFSGPLAPPSDPDAGYPSELPVDRYRYLRNPIPNVRYRILDGVVAEGILRFWIAPFDVVDPWCRMQTPHAWSTEDFNGYRCVPETATTASVDPGALALCTPDPEHVSLCYDQGYDEPFCDDVSPCVCTSDECFADFRAIRVDWWVSMDSAPFREWRPAP